MTTPNKSLFRPVAVPDVKVDGFWGKWQDAVCDETAAILLDRCEKAGMIQAIDVDQESPGIVIPIDEKWTGSTQMFWDSDLGKSIETIAYSLYRKPNPDLEARADAIIDMYEKLQQEDGYVNAWFQRVQPGRRWLNLRDHHELYCAGHLMEAAVAYYQATGKRKLLDVMCRYADHMINVFGHNEGQIPGYCGHQEVELALVKLARVTGEQKYLDLSKFFIDERGRDPHFFTDEALRDGRDPAVYHHKTYEYSQAHLPVREQKKVVGHAVRAMYMYSGMADVAAEFHDDSLTDALEGLWDDLTLKQMYVTGGIGPAAYNEGFTEYYDLPNDTAYAETCASVGLVFWAARMLGRGPNRRYADIMEQALYNGALTGLALDGKSFFYDNPLESTGKHHRWTWHRCPCCPPNIARLVASVGSYMYAVAENEIAVHLYGKSTVAATLGGSKVKLSQTTDYPWSGDIRIDIVCEPAEEFGIALRIPEWAADASLRVNGADVDVSAEIVDGYVRLRRNWRTGDVVELQLPMELRSNYASPKVRQDAGRVALARGPLIYCVEETDNGSDLNALIVPAKLSAARTKKISELNEALAIEIDVAREQSDGWKSLYRNRPAERAATTATLVPYHLWDNREPGAMLVWLQSEG
ncbi:glycoside hydrolase family 127 protein (plasmid) [Aliirhizobium terrae]|uniref:glycoside hydrolase family 127 protein n=1 Tax=Terrirhizobium terrae TaxID=2926709 RepID=UPI002574E5D5|nr:glycoside hydrolase family 127 protein [Rhizobium sp. CC-CFT758]WJH38177.1 glycoside hydrolase family 127 protein [Rhizobium sp. CC-CFT758]